MNETTPTEEIIKVQVEMLAFHENGTFREVELLMRNGDLNEQLNFIYIMGQNDIQPKQVSSVSAGDVIHYKGTHIVCSVGFKELSPKELKRYRKIPRRDRIDSYFTMENS